MSDLKKQKILLKRNTIASLVFQMTTVICGFIVPRLVLSAFGSEVNGLVSSIKQFLGIIAFLELGVGAVVQSSLYKPIADKDSYKISEIITSATKFFSKIGLILALYVIILLFAFPFIVDKTFGWFFTATLIVAISISFFAQYFYGVVDRLFLNAAQRGFVQYNVQTITLVLNAIVSYILIKIGCNIQVFQLISSLIFLARPIYLRYYIKKYFDFQRNVYYTEEPIKQKWNGIAQHIAAVVLNDTDVIVLTFFSTLSNVSIYSVYYLVVSGVKSICTSFTSGIEALEGELWAKKDAGNLKKIYKKTEWIIHMVTVFVFTCTGILIAPFVQVYTKGIVDVNYDQPLFGALITMAISMVCFRLPYAIMILAAGHYKQTQKVYIIAASINICVSVLAVQQFGLIGVALGTLVALIYQTIWMAIYCSKNLVQNTGKETMRLMLIDIMCVLVVLVSTHWCIISKESYFMWGISASIISIITLLVMIVINLIFFRKYTLEVIKKILHC